VREQVGARPIPAIGGRCVVTGSDDTMLAVSDQLIAKVRAEDKKPKK
jgi:hypothetical protein